MLLCCYAAMLLLLLSSLCRRSTAATGVCRASVCVFVHAERMKCSSDDGTRFRIKTLRACRSSAMDQYLCVCVSERARVCCVLLLLLLLSLR